MRFIYVASDALGRLVWESEVEGGGGVLSQRRTAVYRSAQLSIAFALFKGSDNENVSDPMGVQDGASG